MLRNTRVLVLTSRLLVGGVLLLTGCQSMMDSTPTDARPTSPGWSLVAPPFSSFDSSSTGSPRVQDAAPLPTWSLIGRFDSAEACEQSRQETIRFLTREDQNPTFSREGALLNRDRAMLSKCVPSGAAR